MRYRHSDLFPQVLGEAACSLLISTYQAGQLIAVGVADGRLHFAFRRFDQAMGIALGVDRLAVGGKGGVWSLQEHSEIASAIEPTGRYDRCWLPRSSTVTGEIQCHEIAWGRSESDEPELWIVNTLFSCLAGLDPRYSFVPRWRPSFISQLAAQDRCHLNGLAMRNGSPAYVTVMAPTDEPRGWREVRNDRGLVLDVPSGEAVTSGLSMPHSPRWYDGSLYVLNSGMGCLERVDPATGHRDLVAAVPGYARGLAIHRGLAFIGLSKIRETAIFGGAPIAAHHDQLKCGVGIIELATGNTIATLQFANGVEEIFDVQVAPETRCPTFGGPPGESDEVWLLPGHREPVGAAR
ncbi:TIGR03032 family protein [Nocardioides sp. GXQ0305]|uniref:TIGR03032 family protein n=1 Tax=Nocardioides sp. GXQ0305 TaxID=3423912 RepID=UPI003D7C6B95